MLVAEFNQVAAKCIQLLTIDSSAIGVAGVVLAFGEAARVLHDVRGLDPLALVVVVVGVVGRVREDVEGEAHDVARDGDGGVLLVGEDVDVVVLVAEDQVVLERAVRHADLDTGVHLLDGDGALAEPGFHLSVPAAVALVCSRSPSQYMLPSRLWQVTLSTYTQPP